MNNQPFRSFYNALGNNTHVGDAWKNADGVMQTTAAPAATTTGTAATTADAKTDTGCGCSDAKKKQALYFLSGLLCGGVACYFLSK